MTPGSCSINLAAAKLDAQSAHRITTTPLHASPAGVVAGSICTEEEEGDDDDGLDVEEEVEEVEDEDVEEEEESLDCKSDSLLGMRYVS